MSADESGVPAKIEGKFRKFCKDLKGKENRFCYFLGGTDDAATGENSYHDVIREQNKQHYFEFRIYKPKFYSSAVL